MKSALLKPGIVIVVICVTLAACQRWSASPPEWTAAEITLLQSLWIESLPELSPDPSNSVADNPRAADFGKQLFFDTRLSANGGISCATCHQQERRFTDGLQKAQAIGTTARHTPSIVGTAYSPWQFWDGRRDSQWSQALAPLEDANEHATDRAQVVSLISKDGMYRSQYESLFGPLPDEKGSDPFLLNVAFANIGKSIAAFERTIMPTASRFDEYVQALVDNNVEQQEKLFSDDEVWGLRLFIGEANCTQCHNGPLFTNHEFHNTGVISFPGEVPDTARVAGVREVLANEFNCRGPYSDDPELRCDELDFTRTGADLIGAFKTPSLRNLENTAPFMHKGQIATLAEVLQHYNNAPDAMIGHNEAKPLGLGDGELQQIEAFLNTLAAPVTTARPIQLDSI
jgi:cytochrome c peroxidase